MLLTKFLLTSNEDDTNPPLPNPYQTEVIASQAGGAVISSVSYTVPKAGWYRVGYYNPYSDNRRNGYFNVDGVRVQTWTGRSNSWVYYGPQLYQKNQVLTIGWTYNYTVQIQLQRCY